MSDRKRYYAANELLTAYMEVQLERIPDREKVTAEEWRQWVVEKGFHLIGDKDAWIPQLDCKIHGADYIVYIDGDWGCLAMEEEIVWNRPGGEAACSARPAA